MEKVARSTLTLTVTTGPFASVVLPFDELAIAVLGAGALTEERFGSINGVDRACESTLLSHLVTGPRSTKRQPTKIRNPTVLKSQEDEGVTFA